MNAKCEEVIITDILLRGKGTPSDPYRRVVQVWAKDGTLIAEKDEYTIPETLSMEELLREGEEAYREKHGEAFQPADKCAYYWREGYVTAKTTPSP